MTEATPASAPAPSPFADSDRFDLLAAAVRPQLRRLIAQPLEEAPEAALGRRRCQRGTSSAGRRHGHRPRRPAATFGRLRSPVPRARRHDETRVRGGGPRYVRVYVRVSARSVRYRRKDLDAWADQRVEASTSEPALAYPHWGYRHAVT